MVENKVQPEATPANEVGERPSWTASVTMDHPLAIFCPHYYEKKGKEKESERHSESQLGEEQSNSSLNSTASTTTMETAAQANTSVDMFLKGGGCPVMKGKAAEPGVDSCDPKPCDGSAQYVNKSNNMLIQEKQQPGPGQLAPLPTARRMSSIPKTKFSPAHQQEDNEHWEYPSQQMFYNAMHRKGWDPKEEEMSTVVGMHNAVNERSWKELLQWERTLHPETANTVRLIRFQGDATKITPKARFMMLRGFQAPFDRHDWYIDRDGKEVHYVLDFYSAPGEGSSPIGFHIDVRPALDSPTNFADRVRMNFHKIAKQLGLFSPQQATQGSSHKLPVGVVPEHQFYQRTQGRRWQD
eukprot:m.210744 g.210744  ORF g.210744 m.210744 type:complete len:354 (-) comp19018_c0_seq5:120-1181(-)